MEYINLILNNAFTLSILLVILGSMVGLYVKTHSRDRCLKDFEDYKVTLERIDGKLIWGRLQVYTSGLELEYEHAHQDLDGHVENTYVLYNEELAQIEAFYRYHDELSDPEKARRQRTIRKVHKPSFMNILMRKLRNFTNTFKDAILQSFNIILGAKATSGVLATKKSEIGNIGGQVLSTGGGNAFDPILERYIGQYVVCEITRGGTVEEAPGILKEYSPKFLELLNVKVDSTLSVDLDDKDRVNHPVVTVDFSNGQVNITNKGDQPVFAVALKTSSGERKLDVYIDGGKSTQFNVSPEELAGEPQLYFRLPRKVDMVFPRGSAVVRHGGKRVKHTFETLLGLDTLMSTPGIVSMKRALVVKGQGGVGVRPPALPADRSLLTVEASCPP